MRNFAKAFVHLSLIWLLAGCADTLPRQYAGTDGGWLVASLGEAHVTGFWWTLVQYRTRGGKEQGTILFTRQNLLKPSPIDFEAGDAAGMVEVRKLPPGEYELFDFEFKQTLAGGDRTWRSRNPISVPFTIRPGATTYIGNFMSRSVTGRNALGMNQIDGGYFVVADRQERDFALAQRKVPDLPAVAQSIARELPRASPVFRRIGQ